MNSNWYKIILKCMKIPYGKDLLLKGVPVIFNKRGASITIGKNVETLDRCLIYRCPNLEKLIIKDGIELNIKKILQKLLNENLNVKEYNEYLDIIERLLNIKNK